MNKLRIGITGNLCGGKTTLAKALISLTGRGAIASMAGALKKEALEIGWNGVKWDGVKDEKGRKLLQDLGAGRRREDPDYWVKRCMENMPPDAFVDDMRHFNEAQALYDAGFLLVGVVTPEKIRRRRHDLLYGAVSDEKWVSMMAHESECHVPGIIEEYSAKAERPLVVVSGVADPMMTAEYVYRIYLALSELKKAA